MDPMGKSSTVTSPHHDYDPLAVASVVASQALAKKQINEFLLRGAATWKALWVPCMLYLPTLGIVLGVNLGI